MKYLLHYLRTVVRYLVKKYNKTKWWWRWMRWSGYNQAFTAIAEAPGDSCCSVRITSSDDGAADWQYNAFELSFLTWFCSKVEFGCTTSRSQCSSSAVAEIYYFAPMYLLWLFCGGIHACVFLWVFQQYVGCLSLWNFSAKQWQGDCFSTMSQKHQQAPTTPDTCKLTVMQRSPFKAG